MLTARRALTPLTRHGRLGRRLTGSVLALGAFACGGAAPLLEPVVPVAPGQVEFGAGVSSQIALGRADQEIARGRDLEQVGSSPALQQDYLRGAFRQAAQAPGTAPWVGARTGLAHRSDASLIYTGRSLRLGARQAWLWGEYGLSLGGGLASLQMRGPDDADVDRSAEGLSPRASQWAARGVGLDAPLIFGWSSRAQLLSAWVGARAGFEYLYGDFPFTSGGQAQGAEASAQQLRAGGLLGFAVGVQPVWVRVEFAAEWSRVWTRATLPWADADAQTLQDGFSGVSLAPAGAFVVQF